MSELRLRCGGNTDIGQIRQINQDSLLSGPDVFVVADGMGGHRGGEVASQLAVESMGIAFEDHTIDGFAEAVRTANDVVYLASVDDTSLSGMGTTIVGIAQIIDGGERRLGMVNVGDSRGYLYANGVLTQVTDDHSLVQELVREGRISQSEADHHPQRNIVTRALGIAGHIDVDTFLLVPVTGDRYLMCSDGLTNEVSEADIAEVLASTELPDECADRLIAMANEHGGRDNITVLIVDVLDDGGAASAAGIDTRQNTARLVERATSTVHDEPLETTQEFAPVDPNEHDDHGAGIESVPVGAATGDAVSDRAHRDGSTQSLPVTPAADADGPSDRLRGWFDSVPRQLIAIAVGIAIGIGIALALSSDDDPTPPPETTTTTTETTVVTETTAVDGSTTSTTLSPPAGPGPSEPAGNP